MAGYRALLVAVGEYDDDRITKLPFVQGDLSDLSRALLARGYDVEAVEGPRLGRTQLSYRVQQFISRARDDEHLLIVLSGHGVHLDGVDYLVPSDAELDYEPLTDALVEVGWRAQIEHCAAASVLVVVDACRESLQLGAKNLGTVGDWTRGKKGRAARRQAVYLFACSPGEFSRYVNTGEEAFSFFSRALRDAIADPDGPTTLAEVRDAVQARLDELTRQYAKPAQRVLVSQASGLERFPVFPGTRSGAEAGGENDPWVVSAREHTAWKLVAGQAGAEAVRDSTVALVAYLSRVRRRAAAVLAEDPWRDESHPLRTAERTAFLLSSDKGKAAPEPPLTPAEAALLVAVPFLKDAWWTVEADAQMPGLDLDRWWEESGAAADGELAGFSHAYPRLRRRAQSTQAKGEAAATAAIGWWLARRWLDRRLRSARGLGAAELKRLVDAALAQPPEARGDLLARRLIAEIFAADRLAALVLGMDADPDDAGRGDAPGALTDSLVCSATASEQQLRATLVGYLLMLASRLAIDTARLGEILVEHIGIADSVNLDQLRSTAAAASWKPVGTSRILHAEYTHPAVEVALSEHAERVSSLLAAIHAADDAGGARMGLSRLPTRAGAYGLVPAEADGVRGSAGVRFRLADDRIQELLMGEQLYRDRALAIRELYQNALDACRYRQARTEYLRRTTTVAPQWKGRITFRQGVDEKDGRAYLECTDNGIGMGVRELRELFSQAGTRFVDLPEYVAESAEWGRLDSPVQLFPNSRFGIGVLSYFMLADEIVVETCRMDRLGRPGKRLRVTIAGPGALFRFRTVEEYGAAAGTTVRLYLHPSVSAPSCVQVLRELLWVAEFETSAAQDGHEPYTWPSGELSKAAPVGRGTDPEYTVVRRVSNIVCAIPGQVWWCGGTGAVLADGLWAGETMFGAVVNLTGRHAPTLSVDRSHILAFDAAHVQSRLIASVGVLAGAPQPEWDRPDDELTAPGYRWLCALTGEQAAVADAVYEGLSRAEGLRWRTRRDWVRIGEFGCLPDPANKSANPLATRLGLEIDAWRCSAYLVAREKAAIRSREGEVPVLPAHPTDSVLLRGIGTASTAISRTHVAATAARLGWTRDAVCDRLRVLGYTVRDVDADSGVQPITGDDLFLVSAAADGNGPWLDERKPVSRVHVIRVGSHHDLSVPQTVSRLRALGFQTPDADGLSDSPITFDDLKLISKDVDGLFPWLDEAEAASALRLVQVSYSLRGSIAAIAARLRGLGFTVPEAAPLEERARDDLATALRETSSYGRDWVPSEAVGSPAHLLWAAARLGWSVARVAQELAAVGLAIDEGFQPGAAAPIEDDLPLLDTILAHEPMGEEVPLGLIVCAAERAGWPLAQVAARLAQLGLTTPDPARLPALIPTESDVAILAGYGTGGWLRHDTAVSRFHIAQAAARLNWSIGQTVERLVELGFTVPAAEDLPLAHQADYLVFAARTSDNVNRSAIEGESVSRHFILAAAQRSRWSARTVAVRLRELGCAVPDPQSLPDLSPSAEDLKVLSVGPVELDGQIGSRLHLLYAAAALELPIEQVAERLRAFGYQVVDFDDPRELLVRVPGELSTATDDGADGE